MKKSEIYRLAQCCVIRSLSLSAEEKLEILRELMAGEDLAIYCEEQEEKKEVVANETV